ncbi:amphi-Trp domain-containing protein [Methylomarinum vadi]|uniref:amphi-Trp domain-containing protein n=1 Tax=Methylomarinum vadi TaxID=438855 RepID=UPI0004DF52E3|nr:amphi-Trp domain-containing protein [Methylomarinum vadi]
MKPSKKSFQHESIQDAKTIQKILNAISEGIGKGELQFSDEDDEIVFHPEGLMQLKVSAAQDGNQQRFNIKVSWQLDSEKLKNKSLKVNG